jgi:hypothetical protein
MWSWFIYQFYWRFATGFFASLFLFVYGTKFADRSVDSSSNTDAKQKSFETVPESVVNSNKVELQTV